MKKIRTLPSIVALAAAAFCGPAAAVHGASAPAAEAPPADGHGAPAEGAHGAPAAPAAEGHGAATPPPPAAEAPRPGLAADDRAVDDFKLSEPLNNHFDISVLKNRERVTKYRYELTTITQVIRATPKLYVLVSFVVEFGNESGPVELRENVAPIKDDIRRELHLMTFRKIMHNEGKVAIKQAVADVINRRLLTARVRSVYLTDCIVSFTDPVELLASL